MLKKIFCILLVVAMSFSLFGCTTLEEVFGSAVFLFLVAAGNDSSDKEDVIAFVRENQDILMTCIKENDYTYFDNHKMVKSVYANDNSVEFSCGGAGVGSATSYVGFYYTSNNDMTAIWCAPSSVELLVASGDGFEWREEYGDNRYYTEKICEYLYYYEASF